MRRARSANRRSCKWQRTKNQQRGVSMIECCITLAITGILSGSALPYFKDTLDKRQIEGARCGPI